MMLYADYITLYFTNASARNHFCGDQFNSYTLHFCSSWTGFFFLEPGNSFIVNIWLFCFYCRFVAVGATVHTLKRSLLCSSTRRAVTDDQGHSWGRTCVGCAGGTMTVRTVAGSSMEVWFQNWKKKITIFKLILVSLILTHVYWPYIVHVCLFFVSQNLQNWDKYIHSLLWFLKFQTANSTEYIFCVLY